MLFHFYFLFVPGLTAPGGPYQFFTPALNLYHETPKTPKFPAACSAAKASYMCFFGTASFGTANSCAAICSARRTAACMSEPKLGTSHGFGSKKYPRAGKACGALNRDTKTGYHATLSVYHSSLITRNPEWVPESEHLIQSAHSVPHGIFIPREPTW